MAQETGFFSIRRPRETLSSISHNVTSAIPMPLSAAKRSNSINNFAQQQQTATNSHTRSTSGSRMSLAPGRPHQPSVSRSLSGGNLVDLANQSTQWHPTSGSIGLQTGRKSQTAHATATPAVISSVNSQQNNQRRSSIYSGRNSSSVGQSRKQSFFVSTSLIPGERADPRPLKDRSFQASLARELEEYLTHNNFELEMKHSISPSTMRNPTQKDFWLVFQWLYHRIDPNYRFQKGADTEVPPLLSQLKYPYSRDITKSSLTAVGGHNWIKFLAMLHWLMQLAKMMDQYRLGSYDEACAEAGIDVVGDRLIFEFVASAYHTWLSLEDDTDEAAEKAALKPHVQEMAGKFSRANEKYLEEAEMLEAEHRGLKDQIDRLDEGSHKLVKLDLDIKTLEEDLVKFEKYNSFLEARAERNEERRKVLECEVAKTELLLKDAESEKNSLQQTVDKQGTPIQEIDRMNNERERLCKVAETALQRSENSKKLALDREKMASQNLDQLEGAIREYNTLGYHIAVVPSSTVNGKEERLELHLIVEGDTDTSSSRAHKIPTEQPDRLLSNDLSGYQPQHLLNLDAKGYVRSSLLSLRREIGERRNKQAEEDMEMKDLLDKTKEAIEDKQQEVDGLEHKKRAAEEELDKTKDIIHKQRDASDTQIEKLEKELAKIRTSMTESLQVMEQREINTHIEYEQLTVQAAALREELHTEIEKILNEVIKFKVHIQKSLEDYEQLVADECEAEWVEVGEEQITHDVSIMFQS